MVTGVAVTGPRSRGCSCTAVVVVGTSSFVTEKTSGHFPSVVAGGFS